MCGCEEAAADTLRRVDARLSAVADIQIIRRVWEQVAAYGGAYEMRP